MIDTSFDQLPSGEYLNFEKLHHREKEQQEQDREKKKKEISLQRIRLLLPRSTVY